MGAGVAGTVRRLLSCSTCEPDRAVAARYRRRSTARHVGRHQCPTAFTLTLAIAGVNRRDRRGAVDVSSPRRHQARTCRARRFPDRLAIGGLDSIVGTIRRAP